MKKLLTLVLVAISFIAQAQNPEMAEPYLKKADSLYNANDYSKAHDGYQTAYRYDRQPETKVKLDSCIKKVMRLEYESDRRLRANAIIKQLKEGDVTLMFDSLGNVITYQKAGREARSMSDLPLDVRNKITTVTKKDWEDYK